MTNPHITVLTAALNYKANIAMSAANLPGNIKRQLNRLFAIFLQVTLLSIQNYFEALFHCFLSRAFW
jgi:hypothetical protein